MTPARVDKKPLYSREVLLNHLVCCDYRSGECRSKKMRNGCQVSEKYGSPDSTRWQQLSSVCGKTLLGLTGTCDVFRRWSVFWNHETHPTKRKLTIIWYGHDARWSHIIHNSAAYSLHSFMTCTGFADNTKPRFRSFYTSIHIPQYRHAVMNECNKCFSSHFQ